MTGFKIEIHEYVVFEWDGCIFKIDFMNMVNDGGVCLCKIPNTNQWKTFSNINNQWEEYPTELNNLINKAHKYWTDLQFQKMLFENQRTPSPYTNEDK